jgi:predicted extracellular nuclease
MPEYHVAWWNVENLLDVKNSPRRPAELATKLAPELRRWTDNVLTRKLGQLVKIISKMGEGRGPDILGVCEVENRYVLQRLVWALAPLGRNYWVAHHDTSDERGIDVAFLYDMNLFVADRQFSHVVNVSDPTRDIFQVNFFTASGRPLIVIGNHWPSRGGGEEARAFRATAARTLRHWIGRIQHYHSKDVPILVMGDFNDEPGDFSLTVAGSRRKRSDVTLAHSTRLLNLMAPLKDDGSYTYVYRSESLMLDQFLASWGLLKPVVMSPGRHPETMKTGPLPGTVSD